MSPGQKGSSLSIWDSVYVCYSDDTWPESTRSWSVMGPMQLSCQGRQPSQDQGLLSAPWLYRIWPCLSHTVFRVVQLSYDGCVPANNPVHPLFDCFVMFWRSLSVSVISRFLDTEQLLSVLVQIPKQDTVCAAQRVCCVIVCCTARALCPSVRHSLCCGQTSWQSILTDTRNSFMP